MNSQRLTVIESKLGWQPINFKELREYRDLFYYLVWRDIKVRYAQTILGMMWAILLPLIQIVVFTVIFGKVAKIYTDGIPYFLFSTVAIIPWTYMSEATSVASQSLVINQHLLGKIYFPRLIFPLTPVLAQFVNFGVSILVLLGVLIFYRIKPTWNLLLLPIFVVQMMCIPVGFGMWLSALAIRYRDVKHALPVTIRMLMYTAPIVYSASSIPEIYRFFYSLNPIVGIIEGFRSCLLGNPLPWIYICPGMIVSVGILISGALYFKRMERVFVDVI